jgi:Tol biopolymer transport system component
VPVEAAGGKEKTVTVLYVRRRINELGQSAKMAAIDNKQSVLKELERLLMTAPFASATRSAALLRFLVTETLAERSDRLKEYVLGVEVLGRPESFDPRIDPIARVEASRLRNKLELSYANGDGPSDVRIMLPRGTYVPQFEPVVAPASTSRRSVGAAFVAACVISAFLVGAVAATVWNRRNASFQTLRTSVLPPRDVLMQAVALSPDGASIVLAASKQGQTHLYLRSLTESFEPRLMPGTGDASYPFWSPNGRSIGFFADRKLKVIDVTGGEPRTLCDALLGRGGAWAEDGNIYFSSRGLKVVHRVQPSGGRPVPFSSLDTSSGDIDHLWPVLLPDGKRLAFLAANRVPGLDRIVVVNLASPQKSIAIVRAYSSVAFVPDSPDKVRVFFLRNGSLVAQPLLANSLQPVGESVVMARQIDFEPLARYAFLAAARQGSVAFVPGTPFRYQLALVNRSGDAGVPLTSEASDYSALKLSPDGRYLLANQTDSSTGSTSVSKVDLARATVSRITSGNVDFFPVWSPDSMRICFRRAEIGAALSVVSANGGLPVGLSGIEGVHFPSDWSSDGRFIAYTDYRPLPQASVRPLAGSTLLKEVWSYAVPGHKVGGAVFRPGEGHAPPKWVAYTSDESGRDEVYVQSFPDGRLKMQISSSGGINPAWRPDGRELFYINAENDLMGVAITDDHQFGNPYRLFHMSAPLSTMPPYGMNYAVTNDGKHFCVRRVDPNVEAPSVSLLSPENF